MPHPRHPAPGVEQRGEADGEHGEAGPVVVVLGPRDVLGVARRQFALAGGEGARTLVRLRAAPARVEPRLQRGDGEVGLLGAGEARRARGPAFDDFRPGRPVSGGQVHGGRERGERGCGGQHGDADGGLALDEAPHPRQRRAVGGRGEAVQQREVARAEQEQRRQHRSLRTGHGTVGGAVDRFRPAEIAAPEAEDARPDQRYARCGLARVEPPRAPRQRRREAQRQEEGRQPAEPQRRAGLVQERRNG